MSQGSIIRLPGGFRLTEGNFPVRGIAQHLWRLQRANPVLNVSWRYDRRSRRVGEPKVVLPIRGAA